MRVRGQFLKKRKVYQQNLIKEWKQPPVVILQQLNFCNIYILCLKIRIIRRSDQYVQLMNFSSQIFFNEIGFKAALLKKNSLWLLLIYIDVAFYCYYEKKRRTNAHSLSIFILFQLQNSIILRVKTKFLLRNFHAKKVIFEIEMMNIFNNCIAGSLNNNYFPLNESSSLY